MKEFFKKCLEDLELRTGIRQLYWLNQNSADQAEFDRKKNILLESMEIVSKEFSYISEKAQKQIIDSMIVKDQDYTDLNSRAVWKWLNMNKDHYFREANAPVIDQKVQMTQEQNEGVDKLLNQRIAELSQGIKKVPSVSAFELAKASERPKEKALSTGHVSPPMEVVIYSDMKVEYGRQCHDLVTGKPNEKWMPFEEFVKTFNKPKD